MAALAPAALAMQFVGTAINADAERDAAYQSARADEENARRSVLVGEQDTLRIRREERSAVGSSLAAQGGNGIQLTGSIATLMAESSRQAEMDVLAARQKAYGEAENYQTRAANSRKQGDNAFINGMFSAVSGAIGGAARLRTADMVQGQTAKERKATLGNSALLPGGI